MNKALLGVILVLVLGGGYYVMNGQKTQAPASSAMPAVRSSGVVEQVVVGNAKEFTVEGTPFAFSLKEMRVKQGDTVTVVFVNKEGMHDWVVDEFNAKTKQIKAGETDTVTFVADQAGTFEYYCSVGAHRANGMVGKLIVE